MSAPPRLEFLTQSSRAIFRLAVFAGALTCASAVHAQEPPAAATTDAAAATTPRDAARAEFAAGQAAYAAGNYAEAEAHFAKAEAQVPSVQAKYWRAMSLDQLGRAADALAAFELLLATPGHDNVGADKLAQVQQRMGELRNAPADLVIQTTPSGASINVNGRVQPQTTPSTLRLAAGRHRVIVEAAGYAPQTIELSVKPGERVEQNITLSTSVAVPPLGAEGSPGSGRRSRAPGYVTLGIAGVSAAVGTVFGLKALSDKNDFQDAPSTSRADDVERNALIADMAFGVALTLGVTGIVLLVADDAPGDDSAERSEHSRQAVQLRLAPYVSPRGAGAGALLSF